MSERKAVTSELVGQYLRAGKAEKGRILDQLCGLTGWSRDHARRAVRRAMGPRPVPRPRKPRSPVYGPEVIEPLHRIWEVLDFPAGKRLAPFMEEIVSVLERCGELDVTARGNRRQVI